MNKKIAIFGGAFNSVTKAHIRLSNYMISEEIVSMVLLMPCYKSLYNKALESGEHRLKMIELSDKLPHVQPFDWEIKNKIEGVGTYDVMKMLETETKNKTIALKKKNGKIQLYYDQPLHSSFPIENELFFVMGLDNSQKVTSWLNGDKILKEMKFIVAPRHGVDVKHDWFLKEPHIYLKNYQPDDISSTKAKKTLAEGGKIDEYLDSNVHSYIIENNLYKGT